MKSILIKIVPIAFLSAVTVNTYADNNNAGNNFYVGALVGNTKLDAEINLSNDSSASAYVGMGYSKSFEVRAGFLDLGNHKKDGIAVKASGYSVEGLFKYPVLNNAGDVYAVVGLSALNFKTKRPAVVSGIAYTRSESTSGAGARAGLGYRHHIGRISLQAELVHSRGFDNIDQTKLDTIGIGANFSF